MNSGEIERGLCKPKMIDPELAMYKFELQYLLVQLLKCLSELETQSRT